MRPCVFVSLSVLSAAFAPKGLSFSRTRQVMFGSVSLRLLSGLLTQLCSHSTTGLLNLLYSVAACNFSLTRALTGPPPQKRFCFLKEN